MCDRGPFVMRSSSSAVSIDVVVRAHRHFTMPAALRAMPSPFGAAAAADAAAPVALALAPSPAAPPHAPHASPRRSLSSPFAPPLLLPLRRSVLTLKLKLKLKLRLGTDGLPDSEDADADADEAVTKQQRQQPTASVNLSGARLSVARLRWETSTGWRGRGGGASRVLRELRLEGCGLTWEAGAVIAEVMRMDGVAMRGVFLGEFAGRTNALEDAGARELLAAVQHSATMEVLTLGRNGITDASAALLASVVGSAVALKELHLTGNGLTDGAAHQLATALARTTCRVRLLYLDQNAIGPAGRAALVDAVEQSPAAVDVVTDPDTHVWRARARRRARDAVLALFGSASLRRGGSSPSQRFARADGDHAVGLRVLRFLVSSQTNSVKLSRDFV